MQVGSADEFESRETRWISDGRLSSPETNLKVGLLPLFFVQLLLSHMFLSFVVRTSPLTICLCSILVLWSSMDLWCLLCHMTGCEYIATMEHRGSEENGTSKSTGCYLNFRLLFTVIHFYFVCVQCSVKRKFAVSVRRNFRWRERARKLIQVKKMLVPKWNWHRNENRHTWTDEGRVDLWKSVLIFEKQAGETKFALKWVGRTDRARNKALWTH